MLKRPSSEVHYPPNKYSLFHLDCTFQLLEQCKGCKLPLGTVCWCCSLCNILMCTYLSFLNTENARGSSFLFALSAILWRDLRNNNRALLVAIFVKRKIFCPAGIVIAILISAINATNKNDNNFLNRPKTKNIFKQS